ncbi:MAG: type IV pilus assembly protein PilM [Kiritimatiellia bacterium]
MSRLLTLNIGASKAVLAEYALGGKRRLTLSAYGSCDLPAVDINAPETLAAALPSALHQIMRERGIRPAPLVVSLSGQMVFPRFAKFPPVGDAEKLEQLVRYEIEQNVPFPIDEIVSDHQFLGQTADGDTAALIVAAKLDAVRAVTDGVRGAGLKPAIVDVSPMAVCNAMRFANPGLTGCTVLLDIGSKTTSLILVENEKIYNRSIPVAGNAITKEIAQAFGCSFEEAEQLKIERGYVSLGGVTEDADEITDRVSKVIRMVLTRLHAEISRSINFYRSQQGGAAPTKLFLTGGSSRIPQLADFFMETLQVEVGFLYPFETGVALGSKIDRTALQENDAFILAESVGLALRQTDLASIRINLMPPELVSEARAIRRIPFLVVGGVAFLAALGAGWLAEDRKAEVAQAQIEQVESRNGKLKGLDAQLKAAQRAVEEECARSDAFQRLLWQRSATLLRVRAVRESLIPGMWITSWAVDAKEKASPDAPDGVRVTIRGWRDAMAKAEATWAEKNGGKRSTAAEIVQASLKARQVVIPDSVKIVTQKNVKECLVEFAISMAFARAPSALPEAGRKGKAANE